MLTDIEINAFKCIEAQRFALAPLTLVSGTNASGKSTLLQAMLVALGSKPQNNLAYLSDVIKPYVQLEEVLCRTAEAREVQICLTNDKAETLHAWIKETGASVIHDPGMDLSYEETLFYLSADRSGPEELASLNKALPIGQHGQYAIGHFELHKDKPLHEALVKPEASAQTLKAQLAWWLSYITDVTCEPRTQKVTSTSVKLSFTMGDLGEVSPLNTGAGNSYLLKLLIMCLTAKPGHLLLIENPEIHLHPGAQSRLGVLLAFLAARGVQLVVETHCEHLINRVRYEVYKQQLKPTDVALYYKPSVAEPFITLGILPSGHFCDEDRQAVNFPTGFFDSTLSELLEIG
ncbi:AAA family ATPase [Vreelandella salicampi]|uniref:AAA family ATPase n=1 Tax=Vreelandella salicampi TaxID=1449798 RepID=A0A7Z0LJX7_9GAMM|nr:AAA family ATPase [Halomonas salicampi]NYS60330.1 AAA family ATPase [Halomonas salicampi]